MSRVQTCIFSEEPHYMTWSLGIKFKKTLFKYDSITDKFTFITSPAFDFRKYLTVQIRKDLFALKHEVNTPCLIQYTGIVSGNIKAIERARP